jgi:hypothetical protein
MRKLILAAALILAATSAALAQFNPGTVVGNVLQNPASGCGYGYGYFGPGCGYDFYAPGYRYSVGEKGVPGHKAVNGTGAEH